MPRARARARWANLSTRENRERVDGPISLQVKYLGRAEETSASLLLVFHAGAREREREETRNNTVPGRNPNQKADLGPADASVFRTRPFWALGACQFASGINKRVSVWVMPVDTRARARAPWRRRRSVSLRSAVSTNELPKKNYDRLSRVSFFFSFSPSSTGRFNSPIGVGRYRGPLVRGRGRGGNAEEHAHARYNYL